LSKEQEAIDLERQSASKSNKQLENMFQVGLARLMTLTAQRKQKEQAIATLQTTKTDLQVDSVHDVFVPMAEKTKQRVSKDLKQAIDSVDAIDAEAKIIELSLMELTSMQNAISQELGKLSGWQAAPALTSMNTLLQM
jgi:ribosome-binding factor A